jgi:hypothetical protein
MRKAIFAAAAAVVCALAPAPLFAQNQNTVTLHGSISNTDLEGSGQTGFLATDLNLPSKIRATDGTIEDVSTNQINILNDRRDGERITLRYPRIRDEYGYSGPTPGFSSYSHVGSVTNLAIMKST